MVSSRYAPISGLLVLVDSLCQPAARLIGYLPAIEGAGAIETLITEADQPPGVMLAFSRAAARAGVLCT